MNRENLGSIFGPLMVVLFVLGLLYTLDKGISNAAAEGKKIQEAREEYLRVHGCKVWYYTEDALRVFKCANGDVFMMRHVPTSW